MPPTGQPGLDYASLTDDELSQMLKDYGVDVGPVNEATRLTYERKLMKLKTGQASPPSQYEPVDDDDDNEILLRATQRGANMSMPQPMETRMRRDVQESFTSPSRVDSRPSLGSTYKSTSSSYTNAAWPSPPLKAQAESKGIPMWVKVVAVAVVVILIFLIYSNMEPAAVSNIPTIPNKIEV